jgi:hypothetical protein
MGLIIVDRGEELLLLIWSPASRAASISRNIMPSSRASAWRRKV